MSALWYTHINRNLLNSGQPPVRFQRGKKGKPTYAFEVELPAKSRVVFDPEKPILPCGARLVIVSDVAPEVVR